MYILFFHWHSFNIIIQSANSLVGSVNINKMPIQTNLYSFIKVKIY